MNRYYTSKFNYKIIINYNDRKESSNKKKKNKYRENSLRRSTQLVKKNIFNSFVTTMKTTMKTQFSRIHSSFLHRKRLCNLETVHSSLLNHVPCETLA